MNSSDRYPTYQPEHPDDWINFWKGMCWAVLIDALVWAGIAMVFVL